MSKSGDLDQLLMAVALVGEAGCAVVEGRTTVAPEAKGEGVTPKMVVVAASSIEAEEEV